MKSEKRVFRKIYEWFDFIGELEWVFTAILAILALGYLLYLSLFS